MSFRLGLILDAKHGTGLGWYFGVIEFNYGALFASCKPVGTRGHWISTCASSNSEDFSEITRQTMQFLVTHLLSRQRYKFQL